MIKKNLDARGRIVRLVLACVLLAYAWTFSSWIALLLALFTFYEVLKGWCILYQILGINRCPIDKK